MSHFFTQLQPALERGEPFALGIISRAQGSSPQKTGAKAAFFADGTILGTLGGGCLEAEIQDRARQALRTGRPDSFDLVLDHDFGWDDGLICGGRVRGLILPGAAAAKEIWRELAERKATRNWGVTREYEVTWLNSNDAIDGALLYRETSHPPSKLWIAGSGHVAQAVASMARMIDFETTVFDDRPSFASRQYFPEGTVFRIGYWEELFRERFPASPVFGLIVTRGHQRDALVLRHWLQMPFTFLGMIGSRRKKRLIFDEFLAEKIATESQLSGVACPVGLQLGSVSVPEIAVSIVAQLIERRSKMAQSGGSERGGE